MRSFILFILIVATSIKCLGQTIETTKIVTDTLTTQSNLDDYIGKLVTIKGEISNTKIPQILGIDVSCDGYEYRGETGIATGILIKTIVLEKDVDPYTQNRAAGSFYRLKEVESEYDAKVIILEN